MSDESDSWLAGIGVQVSSVLESIGTAIDSGAARMDLGSAGGVPTTPGPPPGFDPNLNPGVTELPKIPEPFPRGPVGTGGGAAGGAAEGAAGGAAEGAAAGAAEGTGGAIAEEAAVGAGEAALEGAAIGVGTAAAVVVGGLAVGILAPIAIGYAISHADEIQEKEGDGSLGGTSLPGGAPPADASPDGGAPQQFPSAGTPPSANDPSAGPPASAPGGPNNGPAVDPNQPDPASAPSSGNDEPADLAGRRQKEKHFDEDDPRNPGNAPQRISDGNKQELQESGWLRDRYPNVEDRREFMEWLERNHKIGEEHAHLRPGSREAEAELQKWELETGRQLAPQDGQ